MSKKIIIYLFILITIYSQKICPQDMGFMRLDLKQDTLLIPICFINKITFLLSITDVDENEYKMTQIGNQIWMAENLKVTKYRNGQSITGVWAYDNDESNVDTYGRLYSWHEVNKHVAENDPGYNIAPKGWHVPTNAEWQELSDFLTNNGHSGTEGTALKSTYGWNSGGNGTDDYYFTALPGGRYSPGWGGFPGIGFDCYFWSSSNAQFFPEFAQGWYIFYNLNLLYLGDFHKNEGLSIRCILD